MTQVVNRRAPRKSPSPIASENAQPASSSSTSGGKLITTLKFALPIAFGLTAALLNAATIRRSISPTRSFAFAQDLPAGTILREEHLQAIQVGGSLDRSLLFNEDWLKRNSNASESSTFAQILQDTPLILSRSVQSGEPVVTSAFEGAEGVQPGSNETKLDIRFDKFISGVAQLKPGESTTLTFRNPETQTIEEVGPFRVGIFPSASDSREKNKYIRLFYPSNSTDGRRLRDILLTSRSQAILIAQ